MNKGGACGVKLIGTSFFYSYFLLLRFSKASCFLKGYNISMLYYIVFSSHYHQDAHNHLPHIPSKGVKRIGIPNPPTPNGARLGSARAIL